MNNSPSMGREDAILAWLRVGTGELGGGGHRVEDTGSPARRPPRPSPASGHRATPALQAASLPKWGLHSPHSSLGSSEPSPQSSSPSHFQRAGMQRPESLQRNSSTPQVIWAAEVWARDRLRPFLGAGLRGSPGGWWQQQTLWGGRTPQAR